MDESFNFVALPKVVEVMMASDTTKPTSLWAATTAMPEFPPLAENATADVCIVGAGIAGLTTAYLLAKAGKSVIVLDDGPVGGGETGLTTAHLSCVLDRRYFELERLHGEKGSRILAESHSAAIDRIEAIVNEEKIDCDFKRVDGYLFVAPGESTDVLDQELAATHRVSLSTSLVEQVGQPSFNAGRSVKFPRQGQFQPLRYLAGLASAFTALGGRIFTKTFVDSIEGGTVHVATQYEVKAGAVVVATNVPFNDIVSMHTKQAAYRTYVVGGLIPAGSVVQALYWDTLDPYHYVRVQKGSATGLGNEHDVLIVGGEDHKTGQADDMESRYGRLRRWTEERFPMIESFEYRWSGQVIEPVDGVAFIGPNPHDQKNVYIATGFSGNGMTNGTIAGILLSDLIQGRSNTWSTLFDPSRISLRSAKTFVEESLNVARQYLDWAKGGDLHSVDEIEKETGAVIQEGLKKVAVYRQADGSVVKVSAVCPHLGCVVHWNKGESTWDCPCHGSRFTPEGAIINGPAASGLSPIKET